MGCFQTDVDVVASAALAGVAIATLMALLPQYAVIFYAVAILYYGVAVRLLTPLCEWQKYYYAIFAIGIIASLVVYYHALNEAVRYAVSGDRVIFGRAVSPGEYALWMSIQILSIFFAALTTSVASVFALKNLRPLGRHPPLPTSVASLDRSIEMLGTTDDICGAVLRAPHDKLQRLICHGDMSVADELPNYALVVATYYVMFRRRDLNLAEDLLEVLKSRDLHYSEEYAVGVLKAAYKATKTCDVRPLCNAVAVGWSALLKELAALHFVHDAETAKRLKCRAVKMFKQYTVYSSGGGQRVMYVPNPLLYFIFHAVDHVKPFPTCQTHPRK
jgi:hypothetical protein